MNSSRTNLNAGNAVLQRMNTEIEMKNMKNKGKKDDQLALIPTIGSKSNVNKVGPSDNPAIQVEVCV